MINIVLEDLLLGDGEYPYLPSVMILALILNPTHCRIIVKAELLIDIMARYPEHIWS